MRISSDFSPEGKRNQGCCERQAASSMEIAKGENRLSGRITSGGLNGVQASHGLTIDGAGQRLDGVGWRRFRQVG